MSFPSYTISFCLLYSRRNTTQLPPSLCLLQLMGKWKSSHHSHTPQLHPLPITGPASAESWEPPHILRTIEFKVYYLKGLKLWFNLTIFISKRYFTDNTVSNQVVEREVSGRVMKYAKYNDQNLEIWLNHTNVCCTRKSVLSLPL